MTGYLFDIDGTITEKYGLESPVDKRVIERFPPILKHGGKIALITGRSEWYLNDNVLPVLVEHGVLKDVLVLGEYTYFMICHGEKSWNPEALEFSREYRNKLKRKIAELAEEKGVKTKMDDTKYDPETGELWFEPGVGVLSVRCTPHDTRVTVDFVYNITMNATRQLGMTQERFDIKKGDISAIVSYADANKENAARRALEILDPNGRIKRWYAVGDSAMDERMADADARIQFVSVKGLASRGVLEFLDSIKPF